MRVIGCGLVGWLSLGLSAPLALSGQAPVLQERLDYAALERIRDEGLNRSQIDLLAQELLDGIGARLTASDQMRKAQAWAVERLRGFGLANVALEPWDSLFGRGWERVSFSGRFLEPYVQPLRAEPQAWSGSTRGTVTCPVVLLEVEDSTQLAGHAMRVRGACVMWQQWQPMEPEWEFRPRRWDADTLIARARERPQPQQPGGPPPEVQERQRRQQALNQAILRFLRRERPAALLLPSPWTYGILRTGGHPDGRLARDSAYEPVPALLVSHEQYGQMWRLIKRGVTPRLEIDVQNRWTNPDKREYNVVGEIPGTDLGDQLVMVGAHFDSWHSGTGATDNGAGSLVMMEAMRILKALNLPLRRTVRIALWSGEEQGLLGSRDYVRKHAAEMPKVSAYLNVDNGSGRLRGVYGQFNEEAVKVFEQILAPFRDLGIVASRLHPTGGTDHLSFDAVGVPGFQFIQDPLEYSIRSHHSYVDTYERLVLDDLRQAATIVAWTVYTLANRDQLMPRKPQGRAQADLEELYRARLDSMRAVFTEADVRFMTGMIGHHAQAILMSELVPERTDSPGIRTLAARIINAQKDEIATMEQWLRDRGQPVPQIHLSGTVMMVHGPEYAARMPGMLSQEQLRKLEAARGSEFDRLFLEYMIQHHRGAVTMVRELFATDAAARDDIVFRLASDIQVDQLTEIARMENLLAALPVRRER